MTLDGEKKTRKTSQCMSFWLRQTNRAKASLFSISNWSLRSNRWRSQFFSSNWSYSAFSLACTNIEIHRIKWRMQFLHIKFQLLALSSKSESISNAFLCHFRIPWDDQTPRAKIGIALFCMYVSTIYLIINAAFVTLFVGICKNCQAFSNQFQYLVGRLNPASAKKSLRELIQYHQSAKE